MDKEYYYRIYGLKIRSDFRLPQLVEENEQDYVDVVIREEIMPKGIHKMIKEGKREYLSKDECWFIINKIAIYRILNGREICVEVISEDDDLNGYLLGSAFGCIFIQRDSVAIHGSALSIKNTGVIITGNMGAGKSTLTSGLISKGYKFSSDDITVISNIDDRNMILPAYPSQKLCRDSALKFGFNVDKLVKTDKFRDKFFIPRKDDFIYNNIEVNYIFEVCLKDKSDKSNNIEIEELKGLNKFKNIIRNIYRVEIAVEIGMNIKYLKNVLRLAEKVRFFRLKRPVNLFTIDNQINEIERKIAE